MTRAHYFLLTIGLLHHVLGHPENSYYGASKRATVPDLGFYSPLAVDGGSMLTVRPRPHTTFAVTYPLLSQ